MAQEKFEAAKREQNKFHALLNAGDAAFKQGNNQKAEHNYLGAFEFARGSSSEGVAEYKLAKFYGDIGEYEKSLELVNSALSHFKQKEPARDMYEEMKQRLLQKIEAQKRGEKIAEPNPATTKVQPIQKVSEFHAANYGSQKQFLEKELPADTEIHRLSKQAMLAEHAGKFGEAKECYEKMLLRKDEVVAAYREEGWAMLHPAVQRTAELAGDAAREKEMLLWIRDFMMAGSAPYHAVYLNGLTPNVRDHLKKRLEELTETEIGKHKTENR